MFFSIYAGPNLVNIASSNPDHPDLEPLRKVFGQRLKYNISLARYTAAQIGGPAMVLLEVQTADELAVAAQMLWQVHLPWLILGGGSNVLVSDRGVRGVVIVNRARRIEFEERTQPPTIWAESGANFGLVARQAASRGLSGLEWAVGIPGTVGGAVVGNAGAHGGDMAGNLRVAEILQQSSRSGEVQVERWPAARLEYGYRTSLLKRQPGQAVVLTATLALERSTLAEVQAKTETFAIYRRQTQPSGASMGSMFKNPSGDFAGRLIEAAGLKERRVGEAQISSLHANFFINLGRATAGDVFTLIQMARREVAEKFGVELELEIERIGDWDH